MFDMRSLYRDFRADVGPGTHKHSRKGWVNIPCPFCSGNMGYHLGYNLKQGYFRCYRCGWHPIERVIKEVTGIPKHGQKALLGKYWVADQHDTEQEFVYATEMTWPIGMERLGRKHHLYLMNRGYEPCKLEREWDLMGTNHLDRDYKFRIIAPVEFEYQTVSFQGRDITGKQSEKYKACAKDKEVMHHKHTLYGVDKAKWDACLVVEGVTGVWRFGAGTLGTFGAQYKRSQLRMIAHRYERAFLLFDADEAGFIAQDTMHTELSVLGCDVIIVDLDNGDSGEVDQAEADHFMKENVRV